MSDLPPPPPPPSGEPPPPPYQPPPSAMQPPPYQPPPPGYPGSPGYMPQAIGPSSGLGLGAQLAGAGWSIALGAISVLVPIITGIFMGGSVFYFYVVPIFGVIRGIQALTRGYIIGGIIGIALNLVGGLISLLASGILNPGA